MTQDFAAAKDWFNSLIDDLMDIGQVGEANAPAIAAVTRALEMASDPAFVRVPVVPDEAMLEKLAFNSSGTLVARGFYQAFIDYYTAIAASQTPPNESETT